MESHDDREWVFKCRFGGSRELRMRATISDEGGLTLKSGDGVRCWEAAEGRRRQRGRGKDGRGGMNGGGI